MTQVYLRKLIAKEECLFCKTVAFLTADFGTRWKTLVDPLLLRKGESFGTNRCGPDVTYATTVKGKKTRQRHAACRRQEQRWRSLRGGELSLPAAKVSLPITATLHEDRAELLVALWSPSFVDPAHRIDDRLSSIVDRGFLHDRAGSVANFCYHKAINLESNLYSVMIKDLYKV